MQLPVNSPHGQVDQVHLQGPGEQTQEKTSLASALGAGRGEGVCGKVGGRKDRCTAAESSQDTVGSS